MLRKDDKKKKPLVVSSGYSKNEDLKMSFVRIGRISFGFGFYDSTLVSLRIGFGFFRIGFGFGFFRIGYIKSISSRPDRKAQLHSILS